MECLNSSTTDASKNFTNNIYSMALVVKLREREWQIENSVLTLPRTSSTLINTALQTNCAMVLIKEKTSGHYSKFGQQSYRTLYLTAKQSTYLC